MSCIGGVDTRIELVLLVIVVYGVTYTSSGYNGLCKQSIKQVSDHV